VVGAFRGGSHMTFVSYAQNHENAPCSGLSTLARSRGDMLEESSFKSDGIAHRRRCSLVRAYAARHACHQRQ
jgi:hypothetical protein